MDVMLQESNNGSYSLMWYNVRRPNSDTGVINGEDTVDACLACNWFKRRGVPWSCCWSYEEKEVVSRGVGRGDNGDNGVLLLLLLPVAGLVGVRAAGRAGEVFSSEEEETTVGMSSWDRS